MRGRLLLPGRIAEGELLVAEDGTIACAGESCADAPASARATIVSCVDAVISPGLVNTHDHIGFANTPPRPHGAERYEHRHDWRKGLRGHTRIRTESTASAMAVRTAELRFLLTGTTSTAGSGGQPGLIRNVDGRVEQLEGVQMKITDSDTFPLDDSGPGNGWPFSSCGQFSGRRRTAQQVSRHDGYLAHVSEGIDAIAGLEVACISDEAVPHHNLVAKQTAIVHGIGVRAADVAKFREAQTALVWSPRSNVDLYGNTAPVVLYDHLGVQIALGTDWLASGSMNFARELRCADALNRDYFDGHFSDEALWKMVTENAAFVVGAKDALGMLKPGYVADIAVFDASVAKDYRAVIEADAEDVLLVLRGGKPLYGDAALLGQAGLGAQSCENLDVCGVAKKACVKQDLGNVSLADLTREAERIYPLFTCKGETPRDEPSCVPFRQRTASAPGATVYTSRPTLGDRDGDGIPDEDDLCPSIFDPVRPLDGAAQPDADGDGIGDACDPCPFTPGTSCERLSGDDIDGDGIPNAIDTCPEIPDPEQIDRDGDGKGDACDPCPLEPNPGHFACGS